MTQSQHSTTGENLVQVRLTGGRYEGLLTAPEGTGIEALHLGNVVAAAQVTADTDRADTYRVTLDLPASVVADGVQIISLRSTLSDTVLGRITLMAGSALDEDFRNEIALLRDELEMLKRAFRRHCVETGQD